MKHSIKLTIGRFLPDILIRFLAELEAVSREVNRPTPAERKLNGCDPLKYFGLRDRATEEKADARFRALEASRDAAARLLAGLDAEIERARADREVRERARKVRAA